jgi:hypothetical protein
MRRLKAATHFSGQIAHTSASHFSGQIHSVRGSQWVLVWQDANADPGIDFTTWTFPAY